MCVKGAVDRQLLGEDVVVIDDLYEELCQALELAQIHRTRTEMEVSVLNDLKFPTPASKYWQAVREQSVMYQELIMLSFEYRKNLVEIKKCERSLRVETDDLERELLGIEIEEKRFIQMNQERVARARVREILDWSDIKAREAKLMTPVELENVDNHQLISLTRRWIRQSMAMGGNGSPAERQNLLGQLSSGINACIRAGLLDSLLVPFGPEVKKKIHTEYGVLSDDKIHYIK